MEGGMHFCDFAAIGDLLATSTVWIDPALDFCETAKSIALNRPTHPAIIVQAELTVQSQTVLAQSQIHPPAPSVRTLSPPGTESRLELARAKGDRWCAFVLYLM